METPKQWTPESDETPAERGLRLMRERPDLLDELAKNNRWHGTALRDERRWEELTEVERQEWRDRTLAAQEEWVALGDTDEADEERERRNREALDQTLEINEQRYRMLMRAPRPTEEKP